MTSEIIQKAAKKLNLKPHTSSDWSDKFLNSNFNMDHKMYRTFSSRDTTYLQISGLHTSYILCTSSSKKILGYADLLESENLVTADSIPISSLKF